MANVKIAISMGEGLFQKADSLARHLHISRSELFSKAMSELIERRENRILLDSINRALEDAPLEEEEKQALGAMHRYQRKLPGSEW